LLPFVTEPTNTILVFGPGVTSRRPG